MSDVAKKNRPAAPEAIGDEALLEWERVCGELEAAGLLDVSDRAVLTLYCRSWQLYEKAMGLVDMHGPTKMYLNGNAGESPAYKVASREHAKLMELLGILGLTPAARHKMKRVDAEQGRLAFDD